MATQLLGIRHHGPGSCRNVASYLEELKPDLILLEGPPEADGLLKDVVDPQMVPPVALLAYQPDAPQNAVFYPFADFSPEWQTIRYAVRNGVEIRMFDLPLSYSMALNNDSANDDSAQSVQEDNSEGSMTDAVKRDPFDYLAEIAGYADGESWWESTIEIRHDNAGVFEGVQEAVTALRDALPESTSPRDLLREAWMRKMLRAAQKENFERIAVVCGAWHVPALSRMPKVKDDNELLKGLPKVKVECTWIPWTYDRLSLRSGYGAGIMSPGWYDYLWNNPDDDGTRWVANVAALLRQKDMDISVAHVIETIRLAHATAALRGLPSPSLAEYNEAVTTVMGFGDDVLLSIIREQMIISDRLGSVPDNVPKVPLLSDVERQQKRLRVPFKAGIKELALDLRKPGDLERSILFHRLNLLGISWATPGISEGKGTFKETWTLYHNPEQIIRIIEAAIWGNTLEEAARKYMLSQTEKAERIMDLTRLLKNIIPADLPQLVESITRRLDSLSAASADIVDMMRALPDLAGIVRYGDVRNLDFSNVRGMLHTMTARILAGGVLACVNIDEDAAESLLERLIAADYALSTLDDAELNEMWTGFISQLRGGSNVHPVIAGYATRMLHDKRLLSSEEVADALEYRLSVGNTPAEMAYWLEGFLRASGTVLLLDENLWNLVNDWICSQDKDTFMELLPILRRTFSEFTPVERRKLGEKARMSSGTTGTRDVNGGEMPHNEEDAAKVLPVVCRLLGL